MDIFKVSAKSHTTAVAGAIAGAIRQGDIATIQAIGAGAVHQAVKAVVIARRYLAADAIAIVCIPSFVELTIEGQERTAIRLTIQTPHQPLPPFTPQPHATERDNHDG